MSKKIVLEVGCGRPGHKLTGEMAAIANNNNNQYIGLDRTNYGQSLMADAHALPLRENSVDFVLCRATLEHLEQPFEAVAEIHRVLKPGGLCHATVPFIFRYHGADNFNDYFRFTHEGLKLLFKGFELVKLEPQYGATATMAKLTPLDILPMLPKSIIFKLIKLLDIPSRNTRNTSLWYSVFKKPE